MANFLFGVAYYLVGGLIISGLFVFLPAGLIWGLWKPEILIAIPLVALLLGLLHDAEETRRY